MDNIGAEVGQKMRSAIKAKLMELDCYVDDELPDYIMVMVANKRTKSQMNEDLGLFLTTKTSTFVTWLHIVLKKLKEVTVTNPDIYKKVAKRKSDEQSEVKTKKEKRDKKVKKEEPPDHLEEKPIIKPDVEANLSLEQQEKKSLTDDLPLMGNPLSENRKIVIVTSNMEIGSTRTGYEDSFDIPLMSEIQDCNEEDLDALEKKIKSVKSRLGMMVESDEENQNISGNKEDSLENNIAEVQKQEDPEEPAEVENVGGEVNEENERNVLADSRQISILENEISESHNKELERLTTALEQEENEEELESYTPKRKEPNDDEHIQTNTESCKEEENSDKQQYTERRHERITFNPDELSPKKPTVRERLGRMSSTSPEGPERDRRRNSFYAGCEDDRFKKNDAHRDFKEWVALRQRDKSRDKRDRSRDKVRDRLWDSRGRSRERRDRSWDKRENKDNNWNRGDNTWDRRDKSWNKRDKSWDRYERIREGRNRSRSVDRRNRSRSRNDRNKSKEPLNRNKEDTTSTKERRDFSDERKERVRERSRSKPKETKSEGILSRVMMSKVSVPQRPPESAKSDDEQVVREVQSLVKVKRTLRTGRTQPNKNLLLRAVAEAQRSVAQAPKSGLTSPKKSKTIQERLGSQQKSSRTCRLMENEKIKLRSLLEQTRKNRILQRRLDLEGCDSSDGEYVPRPVRNKRYDTIEGEYIPKPMRKVVEVPKYVPSFKTSQEDSDESDKSLSPKRQFVITLDGIDKIKQEDIIPCKEEDRPKSEEKSSPKSRSDGRRVPSPIVFNRKEFATQSAVKTPKPNIPDKLPVVHPPLSIKNKERCKYWPSCRQGDKCEFVHPSQTCTTFPQCKSGDNCLYLHPKCKFGSSCTKKECPYDHNVAKPVIATKIHVPCQNCKFYPNCTNLNCPFFHPKPCKFGKFCTNISECPFLHNFPVKRSLSWKSK